MNISENSKSKPSGTFRAQIRVKNPHIDFRTVRAYEKLEWQLNKLGIEVKTEYRIEPALGLYRCVSQILGVLSRK